MRRSLLGLLALLLVAGACSAPQPAAPDLTGDWQGRIEIPASPLSIGLHVDGKGGGTFDLPAQNITAMPLADLRTEGTSVSFRLPDVPGGATFDGTVSPDGATIAGDFEQGSQTARFSLSRGTVAPPVRPQEPRPPFPYRSEDVTYHSGDLTLAGTFTRPEAGGPFTTVLMITGSGKQDRDETIGGHRPFLLLADTLTRAGYAVLRMDDRGMGGSGGDLKQANYDDLTADVLAGVAYLRGRDDVDRARIGLYGHSEGGYLGPLAAQRSGGGVAFVVMMAGPAVSGEEVLVLQNRLLLEQAGASPQQIVAQLGYVRQLSALLRAEDYEGARALSRARITEQTADLPEGRRPSPGAIEAQLPVTPSYRSFVAYDPAPALSALRVPVLAFYGDKDLQVPSSQSEPAARTLLAGNPDTTIRTFPGLNHLMQPAGTGALAEYATIETTTAPEVLDLVTGWLRERYAPSR